MLVIKGDIEADRDRTEQFRTFAQRQARGQVCVSPLTLPKEQRRLYVRRTLREDHQFRIGNRPEGAQRKFDKLAGSVYDFFRGTALLFYRDYAGMDAHLPMVFTIGDVHPENFGVMPNEDNVPFFGVNDFDEAIVAPFSYDVKRGAVGFYLAAKENGFKKKHRRRIVRAWTQGYIDGLMAFAQDDQEKWHQFRIDNSPPMIRTLLEGSIESRSSFLADKIDLETKEFLTTDEIVPYSHHLPQFQTVIDDYASSNDLRRQEMPAGFFRVLDVAMKVDSGTASLGLARYWVLIQGRSDDAGDPILLEMKQARRSVLYGLIPFTDAENGGKATQIVEAHKIHLVGGDRFYGQAEIDGVDYLVRERSPYKDDIAVDELDEEEMGTYAQICAKALAQTHARSDEDTGIMEGSAEERILGALTPDLFVDDVVRFAEFAAKRVANDHKLFQSDHRLGAFNFVHQS